MSAPTLTLPFPDRQDEPDVAISAYDASGHFQDLDALTTRSFSLSGLPSGSGISINSSTGAISVTPNANDLAADFTMTVTCTDGLGRSNFFTVPFIAEDPPGPDAAQTFYVKTDGNDALNGLSLANAWRTLTRANQVAAHSAGDVEILVSPGNYRNQLIDPQNSGTDATHRIIWRVNGAGQVYILGPTNGQQIPYGIRLRAGRQWIVVERNSTRWFVVDGETQFGVGGLSKGDDPDPFARIQYGALFEGGNNCDIGFHLTRCTKWNGVNMPIPSGVKLRLRLSCEQHGTCYFPGNEDHADITQVTGAGRCIVDGGALDLMLNRGGHGGGGARNGSIVFRLVGMDGVWGGHVETFNANVPDGNRCMTFCTKNAQDCFAYDIVFEGSGIGGDGQANENTKIEGRKVRMICFYSRDPYAMHIKSSAAAWSDYAEGIRIAHGVFERGGGVLHDFRDYGNGKAPVGSCEMKNCIAIEPQDRLINAVFLTGTWTNLYRKVQGITVQAASRTASDFEFRMSGAGGPGTITVPSALADHSGVFSGISVVTDANLDDRPAQGTYAPPTQLATLLKLTSDTTSYQQGVALTTVASSDPGTGTTLHVNDALWFPDPTDGNADAGFFTTFQIFCNGANRTYTAVNTGNNRLTVSASFTRSVGQAVYLRIPSGSATHRGYPNQ